MLLRDVSEYSIPELREIIRNIDEEKYADQLVELKKELASRDDLTTPEGYIRYENATKVLFTFSWVSFIGFIQLFTLIGVGIYYGVEFESTLFAQSIPDEAEASDVLPLFAPLITSLFFMLLGSFFIIARKKMGVYLSVFGYLFQLVAFHTDTLRYYMILLADVSLFYSPDGGFGFSTSLNPLSYEFNYIEGNSWFIQFNLFTLFLIVLFVTKLRSNIKKKKRATT